MRAGGPDPRPVLHLVPLTVEDIDALTDDEFQAVWDHFGAALRVIAVAHARQKQTSGSSPPRTAGEALPGDSTQRVPEQRPDSSPRDGGPEETA